MVYKTAETAEDIRRLLRSQPQIVVTASRRSGKTTELLKYAEEKNPNGCFAFICLPNLQKPIIRLHWLIFNRVSQSDIVAKRLLGEPLGGVDINPPLMLNPDNLHLMRGRSLPIFCDEWNLIDTKAQEIILNSGLFVAAVTS